MDCPTEKQVKIYNLYLQKNNPDEIEKAIANRYGTSFYDLSKNQARNALDFLFSRFHPKPWLTQGVAQSRIWIKN